MDHKSNGSSSSRQTRRWLRFSLRELLIGVFVVAVVLAYFQSHFRAAASQQRAREGLRSRHWSVLFEYQHDPVTYTLIPPEPKWPNWFREFVGDDALYDVTKADVAVPIQGMVTSEEWLMLAAFRNLKYLNMEDQATDTSLDYIRKLRTLEVLRMYEGSVTDRGLGHIAQLRRLKMLSLTGTGIRDSGLAHLVTLTDLEELDLDGTKITDDGLSHLKILKKLNWLQLSGTEVTGTGLKLIIELPQLRDLLLSRTALTDAGLEELSACHQIRDLYVDETQVTESGINRLASRLPNCAIISDFSPP